MTRPDDLLSAVPGVYFDGLSSRDHDATLHLGRDVLTLTVPDLHLTRTWPAGEVQVDPPLPGVRRAVKFRDGSRFESRADAAISAWERAVGRNRLLGGVRGLESRWASAVAALAVSVLAVWGFVQFGLPALAQQAARATPRSVLATFDRETVKVLESGGYMGPSKLSAARQAALQAEFRQVVAWAGGGYPYRLLLRDGEPGDGGLNSIGANAFALPDGTIVMTDQLVALAKGDRELMGVLAHESGHVTNRHGLKGVYQALGLTLLTTVVTGDLIGPTTFAAAVPATLLKGGYSRAAETQADEVSGRFMLSRYGTTRPLQDILARLEDEQGRDGQGGSRLTDLLSTHPGTPQRIAHLKAMERAVRPPAGP